eukprot:308930_1
MAVLITHIYFLIMSIIICKATVLLPQPITAQPKSPLVLSNQSPLNPWETITNFLHQTSKTPEISNSFAFFVQLPNIIPNHPLNEQHKSQLLQFYVSLFQKLDLVSVNQSTQKDLMIVIETMISYNVRLEMDMSVTVWNQFFVSYYKRPMQFRDVYVIKLLTKCMNLPGSNVEPNPETFHVILYGIAHQQIPSDRKTILIQYIIKYMRETNGDVPTTLSVYNPLVLDAILSNEEYHEVIRILFAHPKWTFPAAQSNITFFNTLLKYLPSYVEMHRLNLGKLLKFMMNGIMTRHGVVNNVETYKILKDYYAHDEQFTSSPKSDTSLALASMQINQNMHQIIQRFKQIDLGKGT